jgi:hypothetical protein
MYTLGCKWSQKRKEEKGGETRRTKNTKNVLNSLL